MYITTHAKRFIVRVDLINNILCLLNICGGNQLYCILGYIFCHLEIPRFVSNAQDVCMTNN